MTKEADFGWAFLEDMIGWIVNNYNPDDLFGHDELVEWAQDLIYERGVSSIISEEQLAVWAEFNGFVREE